MCLESCGAAGSEPATAERSRCRASFRETKLNGSGTAALAELGWDASGASDTKVGNAITELFEHDLIIAGDRYSVHGPGGTGKARSVTQFYVRAHD